MWCGGNTEGYFLCHLYYINVTFVEMIANVTNNIKFSRPFSSIFVPIFINGNLFELVLKPTKIAWLKLIQPFP